MVEYELASSDTNLPTFKAQNTEWMYQSSNLWSSGTVSAATATSSRGRSILDKSRKTRIFKFVCSERTRREEHPSQSTKRGNSNTGLRLTGLRSLLDGDALTETPYELLKPGTLRRIEPTPVLYPIISLHTAETLLPAIKDIFYSHRRLYEKAKVLHGDINRQNVRYTKSKSNDGTTTTIQGLLLDFDLSIPQSTWTDGPRPKVRDPTPSQSYLATDRHDDGYDGPLPLMYRHDLESLLFVLVVVCTLFERGKLCVRFEHPPETHHYVAQKTTRYMYDFFIRKNAKDLFLGKRYGYWHLGEYTNGCSRYARLTEGYASAAGTVEGLNQLFLWGYCGQQLDRSRRRMRSGKFEELRIREDGLPYDEETMGGDVTADKFQQVLETGEPILYKE